MGINHIFAAGLLFLCSSDAESAEGILVSSISSISYGGQAYKTVAIGTQTWFAENLNYNPGTGNSACYSNQASNCVAYGRLYDWPTAIAVCPSGWHLPSNEEWDRLYHYADGTSDTSSLFYDSPTAGRYLKAASGWYDCGPSGSGRQHLCEDAYGFSALPGGLGLWNGSFGNVGSYGNWWSASESTATTAHSRIMIYNDEYANWESYDKSNLFSVRCVKDYSK